MMVAKHNQIKRLVKIIDITMHIRTHTKPPTLEWVTYSRVGRVHNKFLCHEESLKTSTKRHILSDFGSNEKEILFSLLHQKFEISLFESCMMRHRV